MIWRWWGVEHQHDPFGLEHFGEAHHTIALIAPIRNSPLRNHFWVHIKGNVRGMTLHELHYGQHGLDFVSGEWNMFVNEFSGWKIMRRSCSTIGTSWGTRPKNMATSTKFPPGRYFHAHVGGGRRDAQDSWRLAKARVCGCTCVGRFGRRQGSTREAVFAPAEAAHDPLITRCRFVFR